jgi:hypothetical protein
VPTSRPVSAQCKHGQALCEETCLIRIQRGARKMSTRARGLANANWTAAKRFGA